LSSVVVASVVSVSISADQVGNSEAPGISSTPKATSRRQFHPRTKVSSTAVAMSTPHSMGDMAPAPAVGITVACATSTMPASSSARYFCLGVIFSGPRPIA